MEFIPESEQLLDITLRPFSLHSTFSLKLGLFKNPTHSDWNFEIFEGRAAKHQNNCVFPRKKALRSALRSFSFFE